MPTEDWDPRDPRVLADQMRAYDQLRTTCPVAHSEYLGWSVFRHSDVVAILDDHETFSSQVSDAHPAVPNGFDPPRHTSYRRLIDEFFRSDEMARYEPEFREIADALVEGLPPEGEHEFIDNFALSYALETQQAWLRWPTETVQALRRWIAVSQSATLAGEPDGLKAAAQEFDSTVRRVVETRREVPGGSDDVTTRLLRSRVDDRPITDDEVVSIMRNWTAGELGTMAASIGIIVDFVARHPEIQSTLRTSPGDIPAAIDEILRIHPPLISNRRVTTRATSAGDHHMGPGERVTIFWASANRDATVFDDPDHFDPVRNAPDNLLYGRGIHDCPGAPLARLELRVALEALLAGTVSLTLDETVPSDFAAYPAGGLRSLHIHVVR